MDRTQPDAPEHAVLCSLGYRINLEPKSLAKHTWRLCEGDPRGSFSLVEYEAALKRCIEQGWLQILQPLDFDGAGRRFEAGLGLLSQEDGFQYFKVGQVDFTPEGYALWLYFSQSARAR